MSNSEFDEVKESFDEIIRRSLKIHIDQEDDTPVLSDKELQELGYSLPPSDMYERVMAMHEKETPKAVSKKKFRRKRIIAIAAAIIILACGALSVSAVRVYIFKIIDKITENSIEFHGGETVAESRDTDETEAYKNAEEYLGVKILKPTYLPEGFAFDSAQIYPSDYIMLYYKSEKETLKITQSLVKNEVSVSASVDTQKGNTKAVIINNLEITLAEYEREGLDENWYKAIWNDEKLKYEVDTDINEEGLKKVISGLK